MYQLPQKNRVLYARSFMPVVLLVLAVVSASLITLISPRSATAAASTTLNFQARLQTAAGAIAPDGNYNVEFKLYNALTSSGSSQGSCTGDANCLWTETRTGANQVRVVNGYLTVNLGSVTAFPTTISWDQQLYLTMNIGGTSASPTWDGEMNPRLTLTAVPYAFQANSAHQLQAVQGSYSGTLQFAASLTGGNQIFQLPDQGAAGTFNLLTQNQANGSYIQLQAGSPPGTQQTGNFNISGTGTAGILQASTAVITPVVRPVSDSTTAFQIQNASGSTTIMNVDTTNSTVQFRAKNDVAIYGANIFTTSESFPATTGWTAISGTGSSATATHTNGGGTTALSPTPALSVVAGVSYDINYTVNGAVYNGTDSITPSIGGVNGPAFYGNSGTSESLEAVITATTTGNLVFTPTNGFAGTVSGVGVYSITAVKPVVQVLAADGSSTIDIRSGGSGSYSTYIGLGSGRTDTQSGGVYNTALGAYALQSVWNSYQNTAIGGGALQSMAQGNNNTAVGYNALNLNVYGSSNVAVGAFSLKSNVNGNSNVALGQYTLQSNIDGSQNSGLGMKADVGSGNLQNATAIGAYSRVNQSNSLVLGCVSGTNSCTTSTKVGIGTTMPGYTLDVQGGDINTSGVYRVGGAAGLSSLACTSGQVLQSATIAGGIVTAGSCAAGGSGSGVTTVGTFSATSIANGASISGTTITFGPADATNPGMVTTGTQTFAGNKTFTGNTSFTGTATVADTSTTAFQIQNTGGSTTLLTANTSNMAISISGNLNIAAGYAITLAGGATASRPASPTAGVLYYDSTTGQLLTYDGTKWVGSQKTAVIVAASNSAQAQKDAADYIAGGSNDATTINSALTAGSGGIVYLLPGTYTLGATSISVPNNTILAGSGNGTLLTYPNSFGSNPNNYYAIVNADTSTGTGVIIRDLLIDGNKTNQSGGYFTGIYFSGMGSSSRTGGIIKNVIVQNIRGGGIGYGIELSSSSYNTVTGNTANSNQGPGMAISGTYNTVTGNTTNSNLSFGINLTSFSNGIVTGNTANSNAYRGINLSSDSYNTTVSGNTTNSNSQSGVEIDGTYNTVTGNTTDSNAQNGIYLSNSSSYNTVTGNTVNGNSLFGIELDLSSSKNTISSNNLYNNGGSGSSSSVYISSGSSNQITDNQITDTAGTGYAIQIVSGTNNYLSNNTFSGTGATSISDSGTNTIYGGQMTSASGGFVFRVGTDSTSAFAIQSASGTSIFSVNTSSSLITVTGTLNVTTGYQINGTAGATTTCTGGQFLQNQVVQGGITTGGTCAAGGSGSGVTTVGTFSATSIANGASISGTTITFGPADATNPGMVTTGTQTFAGNKTFTGTATVAITSTTALQIQNASNNTVLGVDTSANQVLFGKASTVNGSLLLYNATNANTVTVQSGVTTASYSITLPTAIGSVGQCLAITGVTSGNAQLGYNNCGGTKTVTLVPEFAGGTFHASGSNNSGFMTSDYVGGLVAAQGYKHNYYQWTTDQATAQNYDIIANYQLPSGFSSFASGSFKVWAYIDSSTSTNLTFMLQSNNGTSCYASAQSIKPSATATWQQLAISDPGNGCTFAANDIVTLDFNLTAIAPATNTVKLGELQFGYN